MTLKKFHGNTIKEARQKAENQLGKTYIVVETKEATAEQPAWVHVLNDNHQKADTYSRQDLFPKTLTKIKKTINENLQLFNIKEHENELTRSRRNTQGYSRKSFAKSYPKNNTTDSASKKSTSFRNDIQTLTRRFDRLEQLVCDQMIGANSQYISHPAFQQLLASDVPHATIASWFNELINDGIDPYNQHGNFSSLLAGKIRRTLDIAATKDPAHVMLFTGPSGAGKSSLILKLALHSDLLSEKKCAIVSVYPAKRANYYTPFAEFSAAHSIPHYTMQKHDDLNALAEKTSNFDHLLIEMPSADQQTRNMLAVKNIVSFFTSKQATTLEIHRVINATLNKNCLAIGTVSGDSSAENYLDFTHLDVISQKGHLLPVMQQSGCAIRYMTAGPHIPKDISVFRPARFARQLLSKA
ncbi:MAG TPA: hypothetical protein VE868_02485 [Balneolaceae bacterium]|nr:hypothetical protein [Balneolaceae bacterium]